MPNNEALQVFYGTIPLIVVIMRMFFQLEVLLKGIRAALDRIDSK